MPGYRTDDDIYRVRLVYLGPSEYTLPIHLPYAQWCLFGVLALAFALLSYPVTGGWSWAVPAAAVAMPVTAYIWRHVNPDRSAYRVLRTAAWDWRATRPPTGEQPLPRLTGRHIRIDTAGGRRAA